MTRNKPSMVQLGVGAAIILATAYLLFPTFQAWIVANALIFLVLLCPLAMVFCMRNMHKDAPTNDDTQEVKPTKRDPDDRP
ncbi:conserved hypothetical protein [Pseudomonas veronii]|uniref:DUF2933 domain-containing protein n=1 Tax=Pseudomonas TaxID=286 RepID=UPI001760EEF0|nr:MULTISPECIES: DUF2933 domain-containing protein [Pseudomonas]WLH26023.1 DUF2933 domain-containing protein [Pseudomonas sp. FP215]CAD0264309.1 conserved hypothetical protein [Pseudomonas veronii]CAD0265183.1 conserved hypothetical protein [Pseudomonas veronii]